MRAKLEPETMTETAINSPLRGTAATWLYAARRAGTHALAIWGPITVGWVLVIGLREHALAFDFHQAYLPAARDVLAGHSPYPPATVAALAPKTAFVYPPLTAFLAVPFTVLPTLLADALISALAILSVVAVLLLLGVRDWRCFAVAFLWVPTYSAIQTANVTLLIALGLALIWRYRHRRIVVSLLVGSLIAVKLFLWPLLIWLVATRRYRTAAGSFVAALALVFVPWAAIGFAGLTEYPHLLSTLSRVERLDGYTIAALLAPTVSWQFAQAVGMIVGVAILAAAFARGRRDERMSFVLTIGAVLTLSPIISMHYFVFLLVAISLFTQQFGWAWAAPLLLWASPQVENGASWQTGLALLVVASAFALAVRTERRARAARLATPVHSAFAG